MATHSRRNFLTKSGSIAAAVGMTSLAGCLGGDDSDNGGDDSDNGGDESYNLTMGGGSSEAISYSSGLAYQSVLSEHSDLVDISVQETGGSAANLRRYDDEGNLDILSTTVPAFSRGAVGDPPYQEEPLEDTPMLGWAYGWSITYIVTRADSEIETVDDLPGHSFWPMWPEGIGYQGYQELLQDYGIWDEVDIVNMGTGDISGAISEGQVEAAAIYETGTSNALPGFGVEIDSRADMQLVKPTEEWGQIIDDNPHLNYEEATPQAWEQDIGAEEIPTSTSEWGMFVGAQTDPEPIAEMLRVLNENYQQILDTDASLVDFSQVEDVIRPVAAIGDEFPVHPGVAEVYKEWDVWDDDWIVGEVE